jgi:hypothetical protein
VIVPSRTAIFFSGRGSVAGGLVTDPSVMPNLLPWQVHEVSCHESGRAAPT